LAPDDWFSGAETLRGLAARILDATPDSIALVPSVSYGIAVAAANIRIEPGQSIVVLEQQFPSNVYAWQRLAAASGGEVLFVRRPSSGEWTDAVLQSIDDNTAVVSVPNCHWMDGGLVDLARVGERARAVAATFVVDASQSMGAYPLSVHEVMPDFLVSVGYKWLLGPYGLAVLYVGPRFRDSGKPLEESWLTREGSSNFSGLVDYTDTYRSGARRFDMGEFPQFGSIPQAAAALEQILDWGVDRIQATLSRLTRRLSEGAASFGGWTLEERQRVGHMIGMGVDLIFTIVSITYRHTIAGM
jgi:selenocysteine lyase/cysteine desulfurase